MAETKPGVKDRLAVKLWSKEKCLTELRKHALAGNPEWVALLLEKTNYEPYPDILRRAWWTGDAPPGRVSERARIAADVARYLLDTIPRDRLPERIAKLVPAETVEKNQVILKLQADDRLKLKPKR